MLAINVRGINSKINNGLFHELVAKYDIVGVTETLNNQFDLSLFPEHGVITGHNPDILQGFFGLAVFIRKSICKSSVIGDTANTGL
jgi:hypothetical protein